MTSFTLDDRIIQYCAVTSYHRQHGGVTGDADVYGAQAGRIMRYSSKVTSDRLHKGKHDVSKSRHQLRQHTERLRVPRNVVTQ